MSVARGETLHVRDVSDTHLAPRENGDATPVESLAEIERRHIQKTMRACGGNVSRTARALGISRSTLYEKMRQISPGQ